VVTIVDMEYREVIRPPWWLYASVIILVALFCFTFAAVVGGPIAVVLFVLLSALAGWLVEKRRLVLSVEPATFGIGDVTIPREQILDVVALDPQALRDVAGRDADARATLVLRNLSTKAGVKVDVRGDATPYWLISSKRPLELSAALSQ
jgi:hypothetical protein